MEAGTLAAAAPPPAVAPSLAGAARAVPAAFLAAFLVAFLGALAAGLAFELAAALDLVVRASVSPMPPSFCCSDRSSDAGVDMSTAWVRVRVCAV